MADATTVYDIEARYQLKDRGMAGKVRRISGEVRGLSSAWGGARDSLRGFTDMWHAGQVIASGFRRAGASLIGFNSDLEQARITMAGMIQLNTPKSFAEGMDAAQEMVSRFQQIAKASVGSTKDFVGMAQNLTRPVLNAGLAMNDLVELTKGAVIASRAFGIEAGQAALDIEQALGGTLGKRDRFARALLEPLGFQDTTVKTKKGMDKVISGVEQFNKLSKEQRANVLQMALTQPAIADMAKAQEGSFSGVMSTFQDSMEMAIGQVGLPLFQRLTGEIQTWNVWIDKNSDTLTAMGDRVGGALAHGFGIVKDAVGFLVENRDVFFALAKTFLAFKAGQVGVGIAKGIGGAVKRVADFTKSLGGARKGLLGMIDSQKSAMGVLGALTGKFLSVIPALAGLIAGIGLAKSVFGALNRQTNERIARNKDSAKMGALTAKQMADVAKQRAIIARRGELGKAGTMGHIQVAEAERQLAKIAGSTEQAEREFLRTAFKRGLIEKDTSLAYGGGGPGGLRAGGKLNRLWADAGAAQGSVVAGTINELLGRFKYGSELEAFLAGPKEKMTEAKDRDFDAELNAAMKGARNVTNVTVHKIEVAAADPNRFVHDMTGAFERFNRAPTQARDALRGGF